MFCEYYQDKLKAQFPRNSYSIHWTIQPSLQTVQAYKMRQIVDTIFETVEVKFGMNFETVLCI